MNKNRISTKDRVMNAAEILVVENGFSNTPIEKICELACISRPGFFYHFSSKDVLARQLIDRALEFDKELCTQLCEKSTAMTDNNTDKLFTFIDLVSSNMASEEVYRRRRLLGCLLAELAYLSEDYKSKALEVVTMWRECITRNLDLVNSEKQIRLGIDIGILANMFVAMLDFGRIFPGWKSDYASLKDNLEYYKLYMNYAFDI